MSDLAIAACLLLVAVLVLTSAIAFAWSRRQDDARGALLGLGALMIAAIPAAAYGATASF